MSLKGMYKTDVITCSPDATIIEAAQLMKDHQVGNVVIVDDSKGSKKPVGLITDRDIVLGAVIGHADQISSMKVRELMSPDLITISDDTWLFDALSRMREKGVSRVPVVDKNGSLCGVLSASAIFRVLNEEMMELSHLSDRRREFAQKKTLKGTEKLQPGEQQLQ